MDWNLVRLFVEVVDAGSMSEAARRRGVTRSGVSQKLRQLEQQINAQLLHRTTRNLKPTEIGRTIYEYGRQIALQFEAARHDVETLGKTLTGQVRLSVPPGVGFTHIAPALIPFAAKNPDLALSVTFNNRLNDMIDADVDIALRVLDRAPDDLIARELCDIRWYFYCTPRYLSEIGPLDHPKDLQRAAFLATIGTPQAKFTISSPDEAISVALTPRFVSENTAFLSKCMLHHMGVAMLPHYICRDLLLAGEVVRVLPRFRCAEYDSKFFILTMPNRFPTAAMEAVIVQLSDTILEVIGTDPSA